MKKLVALMLMVFTTCASGQDYPVKPVRMVVPFSPGGGLDIAGRLISQDLSARWGHPVVVENRPGGTIGTEMVARAPRDGYTLLIISSSPLVTLPQMQKVSYDVLRDLVGITQTAVLTYALVVRADSEFKSVQQLIDAAKKSPGKLNYASAGNGTGQHLYVELIKTAAGIDLVHVPYKGAAPAMQALLSGEVPVILDIASAAIPLVAYGKARALLVTGSQAVDALPGAQPYDAVFPRTGINNWYGIFTASGTPKAVLDRAATGIQQALQSPAVANKLKGLGFNLTGTSGEEFNQIVRQDYLRWGEVIRRNNLRAD